MLEKYNKLFFTASSLLCRRPLFRSPSLQPSLQHRTFMPKGYYYPFAARFDDDEFFMPPPSERTMYTNLFDQADHPKLFAFEDEHAPKHVDVNPTDAIGEYISTNVDPHRLQWANIGPEVFYYQFFEHTFPRQPDLSKGELATGALVTRTSVWETPGEPAIQSIARFEPQNFRPAGYAENRFVPSHSPPDQFLQLNECRLEPGHEDRRALWYLSQAIMFAYHISWIRHFVYWCAFNIFTLEPGCQWPKPVELKYTHLQPGEQMLVSAAGSQIFVRRRTDIEIRSAQADDQLSASFRDPELDTDRCPDPEWLICSATCTHLGCTPHRGGAYGGFLCPCHGSHYDASGRIRAGPAPKNLPIVRGEQVDEETILVGDSPPSERRYT